LQKLLHVAGLLSHSGVLHMPTRMWPDSLVCLIRLIFERKSLRRL
jgi:hypothetical protein